MAAIIEEIKSLKAFAVGVASEGVSEGAFILRLDNPLGEPVWYEFCPEGFNVMDLDKADELEAAFQDSGRDIYHD